MERAPRRARLRARRSAVPADAWDARFTKLATLEDTRDFDALYLMNVAARLPRRSRRSRPSCGRRSRTRCSPSSSGTPSRRRPGCIDDIVLLDREPPDHLPHARVPDRPDATPTRVFATDGMHGHASTARTRAPRLLRWFELRARFGFNEWHSNVYYQKDVTPLLTLVEFADEPEIAHARRDGARPACFFDLALHTHPRRLRRDARPLVQEGQDDRRCDDDTWGARQAALRPAAAYPTSRSRDAGATLLARARATACRRRSGASRAAREPFVDRERMGIPHRRGTARCEDESASAPVRLLVRPTRDGPHHLVGHERAHRLAGGAADAARRSTSTTSGRPSSSSRFAGPAAAHRRHRAIAQQLALPHLPLSRLRRC